MALGRPYEQFVHHFSPDLNILTTIGRIAETLGTRLGGSQRMHPNDLSDPLTFPLAP